MNWTKLAEDRIEEAIANGEFDHLPGQGQPLDLAQYFALPAAERAGATLLKNANVVPPEVQLLTEIGELEEAIRPAEQSHSSHYSHSSHGSSCDRLAKLREQLQE